jgi:hypothetical protein
MEKFCLLLLEFEREYNLKYPGKIGNVLHTKDIEAAIEKRRKYNPDDFNPYYSFTSRSMVVIEDNQNHIFSFQHASRTSPCSPSPFLM